MIDHLVVHSFKFYHSKDWVLKFFYMTNFILKFRSDCTNKSISTIQSNCAYVSTSIQLITNEHVRLYSFAISLPE